MIRIERIIAILTYLQVLVGAPVQIWVIPSTGRVVMAVSWDDDGVYDKYSTYNTFEDFINHWAKIAKYDEPFYTIDGHGVIK